MSSCADTVGELPMTRDTTTVPHDSIAGC